MYFCAVGPHQGRMKVLDSGGSPFEYVLGPWLGSTTQRSGE